MEAKGKHPLTGDLFQQALTELMRSMRSCAEPVTISHDPTSPPAFLRPHSLLQDYVDEADKFQKAITHPLERLVEWVIQDGLTIGRILSRFRCLG